MSIDQAQIEALIQFIDETEDPESVTNVIVAAILSFLNEKVMNLESTRATTEDLDTESDERSAADSSLQQSINRLSERITTLVGSVANKTDKSSTTERLEYSQGCPVVLKSMGQAIDGFPVALGPDDLYFNPSDNKIYRRRRPVANDVVAGSGQGYPDQNLIYCNAATDLCYRWTGSEWKEMQDPSGGDTAPINSLDNTSADKALSAAQGYVLRRELEKVLAALSNSAFSTARPVLSWSAPVTYSITQNLLHVTSSHTGNTIDGSGGAVSIVLTPDANYLLRAADVTVVMAGGGTATVERDSSTGVVTVHITTVTGSIAITAAAQEIQQRTVSYSLSHCESSNSAVSVNDGSRFSTVLSASSGYTLNGVTPTITMGNIAVSGAWDAATRTITIEEVTGDIVISATAVETQNKSITYNLSGVTKVSGATEVEDGGSLTAVLSKGNDFAGIASGAYGSTTVGFLPRDIIVFMGGVPLEQGMDYTATQSGDNITLSIPNITDDVLVMNVQWLSGSIHSDGTTSGTAATRSVYTDAYIPIPDGCQSIAVMHNFVGSGADSEVSNAFAAIYNSAKDGYVAGAIKGRRVLRFPTVGAQYTLGDYAFIRFCAYQWKTTTNTSSGDQVWGTGDTSNGIDYCYLYDETNEKFIWKGRNVTALVTTPE